MAAFTISGRNPNKPYQYDDSHCSSGSILNVESVASNDKTIGDGSTSHTIPMDF